MADRLTFKYERPGRWWVLKNGNKQPPSCRTVSQCMERILGKAEWRRLLAKGGK